MTIDADLYVREGSRFVRLADTAPIPPLPPIPAALHVVPDEPDPVDGRTQRVSVSAPRCVHGSFARWAARNCCAPKGARRGR